MRKVVVGILLVIGLAGSTLFAGTGVDVLNLSIPKELDSDFKPLTTEASPGTGLSWFSSNRLTFSHSLTYGVSSSSTWGTNSMGLWSSRVGYQIANPLTMNAEVGVFMDPSSQEPMSLNNVFLKSFDLEYKPNENFLMRVVYQGAPAGGYPGWAYGGLGYGPFGSRGAFWSPTGR